MKSVRGFAVGDRIIGRAADSHADWCAAYGECGAYRFVGASAIGKLHLRENRPRDDAFAIRAAGVWLAVAVADGVGSRKYSRYGASFAVEALCEHLLREALGIATPSQPTSETPAPLEQETKPIQEEAPPASATKEEQASLPMPNFEVPPPVSPADEEVGMSGTLTWCWQHPTQDKEGEVSGGVPSLPPSDAGESIRRAFRRTRQDMEQFAQSQGLALGELHCTLLGMLLNTETGAVAVGHIGDGLIAALHPGLGARPLVEAPTPGEVGETYVLTQSDWENYLAVRALSPQEVEGIATFYLMTDGVADDCTHPPPQDIFQRWAKDMDREMRKEEPLPQTATRLLRWLATYQVKGSWDDRTLVVIMHRL